MRSAIEHINLDEATQKLSEPPIGRFAPSPTGRMHAGNIFSSLVAWLVAKRSGGTILLRIEDLDPARSKPHFADGVMKDYELLGLFWDKGPFFQSDRVELYQDAFDRLKEKQLLYPCFCTRADIHAASAPHAGEFLVYPGTCRKLDTSERAERFALNLAYSWRIRIPCETVVFNDMFQGKCCFALDKDCGDFIVRRSDNVFAYQLAVVVDDALMGVSSIVRGCDLLSSTAQQSYLRRCLDLPEPEHAHIPLLVTSEGRRIAKRDADASLEELLATYKSPKGVLGHIAYVGGIISEDAPCSAEDLLAYANLDALSGRTKIVWS